MIRICRTAGQAASLNGLCALTEFDVDAAPADKPEQNTELKFSKATADVNPPERELEKMFRRPHATGAA